MPVVSIAVDTVMNVNLKLWIIYTGCGKIKYPSKFFCSFLSNRLEFKRKILHTMSCLVISCAHNSLISV